VGKRGAYNGLISSILFLIYVLLAGGGVLYLGITVTEEEKKGKDGNLGSYLPFCFIDRDDLGGGHPLFFPQ